MRIHQSTMVNRRAQSFFDRRAFSPITLPIIVPSSPDRQDQDMGRQLGQPAPGQPAAQPVTPIVPRLPGSGQEQITPDAQYRSRHGGLDFEPVRASVPLVG